MLYTPEDCADIFLTSYNEVRYRPCYILPNTVLTFVSPATMMLDIDQTPRVSADVKVISFVIRNCTHPAPIYCGWYCKGYSAEQKTAVTPSIQAKVIDTSSVSKRLRHNSESKFRCNEHKEEPSLMCVSCNVPVCTRCVAGKHNRHEFSTLADAIAQIRGYNETTIRTKTNEANQNEKNIGDSLRSFDNATASVIKDIIDESNMIKSMIDKFIAQKIALVKEESTKEKNKLTNMLSDARSVRFYVQELDKKRKDIDTTREDGTMVQQIIKLKEKINKLHIDSLPEFPKISFNRKSVDGDDIRKLIGTHSLR
ncbi:unnamed protein product [Mytilus edulis]|uniref:B box-type domain-containing protein n=1 Tax=Mytilus edulis TaxID=6550 RepID=A0A8S3TJL1_MYTED|nr:unnamed protein product [Mytilus edulis]